MRREAGMRPSLRGRLNEWSRPCQRWNVGGWPRFEFAHTLGASRKGLLLASHAAASMNGRDHANAGMSAAGRDSNLLTPWALRARGSCSLLTRLPQWMVATVPTLECRRLAAIRICSHPGRFAPGAPARFSRGCLVGEKPRRQQRHWPARRALFLALAPC